MGVRGVQFLTDTDGQKTAVLLDLKEWGELWEDIYDNIVADERVAEPTTSLKDFEAELRVEGLLNE